MTADGENEERTARAKVVVEPASSGFSFYCGEHRQSTMQKHDLDADDGAQVEWCTELLASAWRDESPTEREHFDACAALDGHRYKIECLRQGARTEAKGIQIGAVVRAAVNAVGRAPRAARTTLVALRVVEALEELDRRMSRGVRARVGAYLGPCADPAALDTGVRKALGNPLGSRLLALLRRWREDGRRDIPDLELLTLPPTAGGSRGADNGAAGEGTSKQGPARKRRTLRKSRSMKARLIRGDVRKTVTGLFTKALAKNGGEMVAERAVAIEAALYELAGQDCGGYRRRARSLTFNLSAADDTFIAQILAGSMLPSELVTLHTEDLAPEAVKIARREERERYFKREVHDTAKPLKKRRDFMYMGRGRVAERLCDGGSFLEEDTITATQQQAEAPSQDDSGRPEEGAEEALRPFALDDDIGGPADDPCTDLVAWGSIGGSPGRSNVPMLSMDEQGILADESESEVGEEGEIDEDANKNEQEKQKVEDEACEMIVADLDRLGHEERSFSEVQDQDMEGDWLPFEDTSSDLALAMALQEELNSSSSSSSSSSESSKRVSRTAGERVVLARDSSSSADVMRVAVEPTDTGLVGASSASSSSTWRGPPESAVSSSSSSGAVATTAVTGSRAATPAPGSIAAPAAHDGGRGEVANAKSAVPQLVAMGFDMDAAEDALCRTGGNVEAAVELLCSGGDPGQSSGASSSSVDQPSGSFARPMASSCGSAVEVD
eukprot:TRINITY_DN33523_c0_g1_i1.p1 TRINITY_DN33523_c0_g1~~TRINITY_DN33523_c0_g1_i1.p1  ORF type:complete len:756 (-),score=139.85 TRINITY_DN33523_c0_g1_i1:188-2365(-)